MPWTIVRQAPLFIGFSRQEYWSGLSFPSPGDLSNPEIEPALPALAGTGFYSVLYDVVLIFPIYWLLIYRKMTVLYINHNSVSFLNSFILRAL